GRRPRGDHNGAAMDRGTRAGLAVRSRTSRPDARTDDREPGRAAAPPIPAATTRATAATIRCALAAPAPPGRTTGVYGAGLNIWPFGHLAIWPFDLAI